MAEETGSVPQWFADFAVKNADEHGALANSISETKGELSKSIADFTVKNADEHGALAKSIAETKGTLSHSIAETKGDLATELARSENRMIRWTAGLIFGGLAVAVGVLSTIIILVN